MTIRAISRGLPSVRDRSTFNFEPFFGMLDT